MKFVIERVKAAFRKLKNSIIQPCPPEIYACEVCGKVDCSHEEWVNCEYRLKIAAETKQMLASDEEQDTDNADVEQPRATDG